MLKEVVFLTGGSRGLGLAILDKLLHGSMRTPATNVVTLSRSIPEDLKSLAERFPENLAIVQGDVTSLDDNKRAVDEALKRWNRLDAVILNAAIADFSRIENLTSEVMLKTLNVNTVSLITTIRSALPELRKHHGRVVFVSSGAALGNYASWAPYSASKAAMNSIALTLANEEPDIASFSVRPGVVDTDMQGQIRDSNTMKTDEHKRFLQMHKEGKLLPAEKPAGVLAALAVRGSRTEPKKNGQPLGEGVFVSWDDPALDDYHN
ncbi:hypothetical protein MPSI1_002857 [Malassezia psittaci]|uniref:Ketoreductase domain-containing protein n=1 Tax=Malassezia psittaci TaxID=1821823 RepID=A0AAF0JLI3_9BASI|nr:hypothetical protein MPSI1_002857 [Malassezia psittaci]